MAERKMIQDVLHALKVDEARQNVQDCYSTLLEDLSTYWNDLRIKETEDEYTEESKQETELTSQKLTEKSGPTKKNIMRLLEQLKKHEEGFNTLHNSKEHVLRKEECILYRTSWSPKEILLTSLPKLDKVRSP